MTIFERIAIIAALPVALLLVRLATLRVASPIVWWPTIWWFRLRDWLVSPTPDPIVFVGSSSIRFWSSLARDMAPRPVINRGFGGSRMNQVAYFVEPLVIRHRPQLVVVYAGENELAGILGSRRSTAEDVLSSFQQFCQKLHAALPAAPIFFLAIKLSPIRSAAWDEMRRANEMIRRYCEADSRRGFIDVEAAMRNPDGSPRDDLYRWDGIHLNTNGYAIWRDVVLPYLEPGRPRVE